jgi:hypothetical protein
VNRRAGIFDPWRQTAVPPIDNAPVRKTPTEISVDERPQAHCIQFAGLKAGVFVWLNEVGEEDSARARGIVVDLVNRISAREGIAKILHSWGVYTGVPKQPNTVVLMDKGKTVAINVPVEDSERLVPRAIDNLSLALREVAQQYPDVRDTLSALKVKPYLK